MQNIRQKINSLKWKDKLAITLGLLWALDSVLQLQPQMFTRHFTARVITPVIANQPHWFASILHNEVVVLSLHPAVSNTIFALIQLGIAASILYKPWRRYGLWASIAWAASVWVLGEGVGGLLMNNISLFSGAPGAAMLYVLLGLVAVEPSSRTRRLSLQSSRIWLPIAWFIIWVGSALDELLTHQLRASPLATTIAHNASGSTPGWLGSIDAEFAHGIMMMPHRTVIFIFISKIIIGVSVFLPDTVKRICLTYAIEAAIVIWAVGESFGGVFSGLATDPNSGPLFCVYAVVLMSRPTVLTSYALAQVKKGLSKGRGGVTAFASR